MNERTKQNGKKVPQNLIKRSLKEFNKSENVFIHYRKMFVSLFGFFEYYFVHKTSNRLNEQWSKRCKREK